MLHPTTTQECIITRSHPCTRTHTHPHTTVVSILQGWSCTHSLLRTNVLSSLLHFASQMTVCARTHREHHRHPKPGSDGHRLRDAAVTEHNLPHSQGCDTPPDLCSYVLLLFPGESSYSAAPCPPTTFLDSVSLPPHSCPGHSAQHSHMMHRHQTQPSPKFWTVTLDTQLSTTHVPLSHSWPRCVWLCAVP